MKAIRVATLGAVLLLSGCAIEPEPTLPPTEPITVESVPGRFDALLADVVTALEGIGATDYRTAEQIGNNARGFSVDDGQCVFETGTGEITIALVNMDRGEIREAVNPVVERHGFSHIQFDEGAQSWFGFHADDANGSTVYVKGRGVNVIAATSGPIPGVDEAQCEALTAENHP